MPATLFCALGCTTPAQWPEGSTWAFDPPRDDFRADALLDLRGLNEKVAGEAGFVRVDAKGDFVLGSGKPARFWAVGTDVGREKPFNPPPLGRKTEPDLAYHARFLAKRGVNMVRCHAFLNPPADQPIDGFNAKDRDWIWRTVAAMKKEGVYTTISPYFALTAKPGPTWGLEADDAHALLFFHPKLQAAYKGWLKKLFTEKNPYTGIPLSQDPAVAVIQIQNEDSLFFWTVNNLKGAPREMFKRQYGAWLTKRYGSLPAASQRWQGNTLAGDDLAGGKVDFHNIWEMTQVREGGMKARLDDQTRFWAETQRNFYAEIRRYLRDDLGCKQLVNASNWKTADTARLYDVERWTYTATEVDAVNRYFGGLHRGPNEGWAIQNGDKFTSESVLLDPRQLPVNLKQTVGRPMLITESTWVMPNGYASEGPLLVAAYQSLNGVDAFYWFSTGDDGWTPPQSANGYNPSQGKWLFANPDMLGTFPAAALMYRKGYVQRGAPVLVEKRAEEDVLGRRTAILNEEPTFDPNRDAGDIAPKSAVRSGVSPYAFLVGPAQIEFGGDPAQSSAQDLKSFLDIPNKTVKSNTGEFALDWGKGSFTVNTPNAQGVSAFFGRQGTFRLADVTFSSQNGYGSALAVSLDDKPLAASGRVLVQFGTQSRPTGWKERGVSIERQDKTTVSGFEVVDYGKAPWQVASARLTVIVKNKVLKSAVALDANGNRAATVAAERSDGGLRFTFPNGTLYVVLSE